jgi:hypothetical protein
VRRRRQHGFANHDQVELHLGVVPGHQAQPAKHTAYLWVDDADAIGRERQMAGLTINLPQNIEWSQHEGAVVDPDGNVLRFGSPLRT